MKDAEKLSLAYQLMAQDPASYPDVTTAMAQVEADAAALIPALPGPSDVAGTRFTKYADGTTKTVEILGDGTERAV